MGSSSKWTVEEFHCEQMLREEFGVEPSDDGVQIAYDMMGRLFGKAYCTPARKTNGNKYSAQRFQDRWTQRFKPSQPKIWRHICNGPYSTEDETLRADLRDKIKAAAEQEGDTNLLSDQPNRCIALGRPGSPARYALPRRPISMVHADHLKPAIPNEYRQAKYKPMDALHSERSAFKYGGQVIRIGTLDDSVLDAMVCDAPYCFVCTAAFLPPAENSPFEGRAFLHLWRDCEPGLDPLEQYYTFKGAKVGRIKEPMVVTDEKQEVEVQFMLDGKPFVDRVLSCISEECEVCHAYSSEWTGDDEAE
ncbi:hypothetical protein CKM354_001290300 [Cercospora kikuchii]|uniref:Uncharacterized protein n=1 Tax=Cercospora kikuchii TaxID=84275 RepID=A0A9P3L1F7_9PEZI|nr:uncharacterized protein CKM354_001290300 [Cercospora kikuchii]GIZ49886.1 hypothetical protein CKM354_001290300 [Cercospora kikuchii]